MRVQISIITANRQILFLIVFSQILFRAKPVNSWIVAKTYNRD